MSGGTGDRADLLPLLGLAVAAILDGLRVSLASIYGPLRSFPFSIGRGPLFSVLAAPLVSWVYVACWRHMLRSGGERLLRGVSLVGSAALAIHGAREGLVNWLCIQGNETPARYHTRFLWEMASMVMLHALVAGLLFGSVVAPALWTRRRSSG